MRSSWRLHIVKYLNYNQLATRHRLTQTDCNMLAICTYKLDDNYLETTVDPSWAAIIWRQAASYQAIDYLAIKMVS